ncbi:5-dehydro-4-deoxy-D-glucuronate isomerase [Clostridium baratii]|uniref:5-dehydro-4-deoxy-D-glucuronate isomerase n=1 Tax=Clostridium baratii TaxID=1561 RepID=UPI00097FAA3B|nr:5-dehydro-4-deoxy-D-glucuronate isomerase [Clostridium baratii]AQM58710.1 5-dehydro-4-deoxy-D-glucuronate isomerase [Clostridium baratii]
MEIRYSVSPDELKNLNTEELRNKYLIESIFVDDSLTATYCNDDRIIVLGAKPVNSKVEINISDEIGSEYFLENREMAVINIGGEGTIYVDDAEYNMVQYDGMYIGKGTKKISFTSKNINNPAKFYMNSASAHKEYPTVKIEFKDANPMKMGSDKEMNKRTIYKYVDPSVCESCQLLMGMTILEEGSGWNTMPVHLHPRRMEVYFYFNMEENTRVFHLVGKPDETRHIVMKNEEATISPNWSIHSGTGTSNYTFIWGMCGENKNYNDLEVVDTKLLK